MGKYFVGRKDELDAFRRCFTSKTQNGIYYFGVGGIGKSVLLKKIVSLSNDEPDCQACFIDFFSTSNRSIEGLQNTIIARLNNSQAFQEIFATREKIEELRTGSDFSYRTELISSLQKQTEVMFSRCCNEAVRNKKRVVLVFDSFEYIQKRDIGRWFLSDFLPNIKTDGKHGIIIVLAGRPEPTTAKTPPNIIQYPLSGLRKQDFIDYVERIIGIPWADDFEIVFQGTRGNPLLIELVRWCGRRELMTDRQRLQEIIENPAVMAKEIFHEQITKVTSRNRVLWAIATFKRRFDFDMLKYLVKNMRLLRNADSEDLQSQLQELPFVKRDEEALTHLLHDAVVEPISIVFKDIVGNAEFSKELFQKIVHEYYPQLIEETQIQEERIYLQSEQLGYILDWDLDAGIAEYQRYLQEIRKQSNYDFEELLWGELLGHTIQHPQKCIDVMLERAKWLYENGLYRGLETLGLSIYTMKNIKPENRLKGSQYCGFALMRQGKLFKAKKQFQNSFNLAEQLKSEKRIIETENNFGQLSVLEGNYNKAAEHYWVSIKRHSKSTDSEELATSYSSRGFCLAMQGDFHRALSHCRFALKLFEKYPNTLREIYAFRNAAIVHRLSGDYNAARLHLIKGHQLAEKEKYLELEADVLRELAHTIYLRGRRAREENMDINLDCNDQARALGALISSLDKARTIRHRIQISKSLIQLAYVFEEIARIELAGNNSSGYPFLLVEELLEEAQTINITEDVYWLQHGIEHFSDKPFSDLKLLQKVARLFENGALEAAEANQFHVAIESQAELTRILIELKEWDDVEMRIKHIRKTHSGVYDDNILIALVTLLQADIAFDRGDFNGALTRYSHAIPAIVSARGTITDIAHTRLNELLKRIKSIKNIKKAVDWCRVLQETWLDADLESTFPAVIESIQILSHELLEELS